MRTLQTGFLSLNSPIPSCKVGQVQKVMIETNNKASITIVGTRSFLASPTPYQIGNMVPTSLFNNLHSLGFLLSFFRSCTLIIVSRSSSKETQSIYTLFLTGASSCSEDSAMSSASRSSLLAFFARRA